ncbi:transaldolase [Streptomyces sp. HU2014]|uniref:transaldolase family protein n=1 Tax=Streptomyces sp. HU2014 TaxID=2939414 RepID=UPI00200EB3A7|nr:transaldolase family protein [Streptomyces sp. HU2014]UQI47437.1 transaldolase [Streptomyces sp. HU2014]
MISDGEVLRELLAEGVSPWLDGLCRSLLAPERLAALVREAGVRGATSNPRALAADMARGTAYRQQLSHLACRSVPLDTSVQALCAYDLRSACDELRPVFDSTGGRDGHVSMDLDPHLAHDARATVVAAVALNRAACRPNALVKIPATDEGITAVGDCLARGVGVHVTEIFSVRRYEQVVEAYFDGLERALTAGRDLAAISSLASVPVARLDAEIDARLRALAPEAEPRTAAVAVARLVYRLYEERLGSERWRILAAAHAHPQRLMWEVSTPGGPAPEVPYVAGLVAWGTVSAMSEATLEAVARECRLQGDTLTGEAEAARGAVAGLERRGVSLEEVAKKLEADGVDRLVSSWRALRGAVEDRLRRPRG